jgi:hypothetical protein
MLNEAQAVFLPTQTLNRLTKQTRRNRQTDFVN